MHGVKPITAEHSPTARPAELNKVKPSGPALVVYSA